MTQDNLNIWTAVNIKPNQANKAEANICKQGFTYLAPKIKLTKRKQNRFITKFELLFPGYIFVQIHADRDDARKLASTFGVSNIVRIGTRVGIIPKAFIDTIRLSSTLENNGLKEDLMIGQKVKIIKGPFSGFLANLISIDSPNRVKCLFDLLNGKITASVMLEDLSIID